MERTIYSKYSNERAKRFCIRTDIVMDESGEKKVYKHALTDEGRNHVGHMKMAYEELTEAYRGSGITFCDCEGEKVDTGNEKAQIEADMSYVIFPFLKGVSLQDVMEKAVQSGDEAQIEGILREYIRRVMTSGGEIPFQMTPEFAEVFGDVSQELTTLPQGTEGWNCGAVSDIDMILSNIFAEKDDVAGRDTEWKVIDYEWTFEFPIPKVFIIYRALYFAYYQILHDTKWSLAALYELAGITEDMARVFGQMEVGFQQYLGTGSLPVRNMQRLMGTKIIPFQKLMGADGAAYQGSGIPESEWIKVRKLQYHIDRREYQDGSVICSGWAFAKTKDGRCLPVEIRVTDETGSEISAEIGRRERSDVAKALKIRNVTKPMWGFDCVWLAPPRENWKIHFSLGNQEKIYEG